MKTVSWLRCGAVALLAAGALAPPQANAEVPPRFYWKSLAGGNAVPVIFQSMSGNTNPFDPANTVNADASFEGTLAMVGYARTFALFDRAALAAVIVPMGNVSADFVVAGNAFAESARGYGDPMLEFNINLLGPPAQKTIPDVLRYEPGFSLDLIADLAIPIGEYDDDKSLNIGQNRWYGRLGFPVVWQLGAWVPGRRMTLELMPVVWLFGDNDDFVGQTLETDPMFELEARLTRDFTPHFWGSLDLAWYSGAKATIDGVEGEKLDNLGLGFTLGYQINDNLGLTFGYKSTVNDSAPDDLQMDVFQISVVYGWHPIVEGMKRLKSE